jgi:tetratricopeptide (TPR) repeat protein
MQNEQLGKYEAALDVYKELLKKNPANLMVMKRKVCVFKAMGDAKRQIEELNALLTQFPAEVASWLELGELYLSLSDNSVIIALYCPPVLLARNNDLTYTLKLNFCAQAAAHCFEEAILLNPGSAAYHTRLAEVYYTLGQRRKAYFNFSTCFYLFFVGDNVIFMHLLLIISVLSLVC